MHPHYEDQPDNTDKQNNCLLPETSETHICTPPAKCWFFNIKSDGTDNYHYVLKD
jgi:hypothetical protein